MANQMEHDWASWVSYQARDAVERLVEVSACRQRRSHVSELGVDCGPQEQSRGLAGACPGSCSWWRGPCHLARVSKFLHGLASALSRAGGVHTLVFSIPALNLLVCALLHLSFEDSCARRLVEFRNLQDVCGIDPVVDPSSHDMITGDIELVNWYLAVQC